MFLYVPQKRTLALFLAILMVTLAFPAVALAAGGPGQDWYYSPGSADGSADHPYIISGADDLAGLAGLVNGGNSFEGKHITIATATSIDMAAYPNWTPIGTLTAPFKGRLDGNGVTLLNLTISDTRAFSSVQSFGVGLFGLIGPGGSVKNLSLSSASIRANYSLAFSGDLNSFIGGIAGMNEGIISNCNVSGEFDITGVVVKAGGIAGSNGSDSGSFANTAGTITDCNTDCNISVVCSYQLLHAGGIAGSSTRGTGSISGCSSEGAITVGGVLAPDSTYKCSPNVGGLIGYADKVNVSNCESSVAVTVTGGVRSSYSGGLIGFALNSIIDSCSSTGDVAAYGDSSFSYDDTAAGGLIGRLSYASAATKVQNSFSTGDAQATVKSIGKAGYSLAGGFVGYVKYFGPDKAEIVSCYATGSANAAALDNGYAFAGGFAGYLYTGLIDKCFSAGDVQANAALGGYASAGGLAGYASSYGVTTASISNAYCVGNALANCETKERAGGFVGAVGATSEFTDCYSAGEPQITHSGATFAVGGLIGAAAGTYTFTDLYYDNTVNPSIPAMGVGSGTVAALSTDSMVADDTLTLGMSGLTASGAWTKRPNIGTESYYPELTIFAGAGGVKGMASRNSVTIAAATYTLMVINGNGSGNYAAGQAVPISADAPASGQQFYRWTSSTGGSFANETSATTVFTMPANAVTVSATYQPVSQAGSDSGDTGSAPVKTITVVEAPRGIDNPRQITVTPVGDAFDQSIEVRLKDDTMAESQIRAALEQSVLKHDMKEALVYPLDISMYIKGTNTKVQPKEGSSVEITCPIPKELLAQKEKLVVVCLIDGKLTVLQTRVVSKGGGYYVQFTASHFSPYAFVVDENGKLGGLANVTPIDPLGIPKTGGAGLEYVGAGLIFAAMGLRRILGKKKQ